MKKKVLFLTYTFPPVGGAGVQRVTKFVKYLSQFKWEAVVMTCANPSVPLFDDSLLQDIPANVMVVGTKTFEPSYDVKKKLGNEGECSGGPLSWLKKCFKKLVVSMVLPDAQILWWPHTALRMWQLIKAEKIDIVFATAPPFSVLVLATFLGRLRKVPVVVDFRDEWVFSRAQWENAPRGRFAQFIDKVLERFVVQKSSGFIAATQSYIDGICQRHPKVSSDKGQVITNGYDDTDFKDVVKRPLPDYSNGRIHILYTGTVWKATSLRPFMNALRSAMDASPALKEKLLLTVIGRVVDEEKDLLNCDDFAGMVQLLGYQEHSAIIQELVNANIMLLTLTDLPGAGRIIPGKTFEYMASGNQVLALVPEGEVSTLLKENYLNSIVLNPDDVVSISEFLTGLISSSAINQGERQAVGQFSRRSLALKLAKVFDGICQD